MNQYNVLPPQLRILKVLSTGPKSSTELIRETNLSTTTLYYNIKILIINDLVVKIGKGRYAITDKGRDLLRRIVQVLAA